MSTITFVNFRFLTPATDIIHFDSMKPQSVDTHTNREGCVACADKDKAPQKKIDKYGLDYTTLVFCRDNDSRMRVLVYDIKHTSAFETTCFLIAGEDAQEEALKQLKNKIKQVNEQHLGELTYLKNCIDNNDPGFERILEDKWAELLRQGKRLHRRNKIFWVKLDDIISHAEKCLKLDPNHPDHTKPHPPFRMPGGKADADEVNDTLATALRELGEETGICIPEERWGEATVNNMFTFRYELTKFHVLTVPEGITPNEVNDRETTGRLRWVSLEDLKNYSGVIQPKLQKAWCQMEMRQKSGPVPILRWERAQKLSNLIGIGVPTTHNNTQEATPSAPAPKALYRAKGKK